jgi:hypothetical protein
MQPIDLRSEVEINAPPEHVFRVLTDFSRYHEWNPFIPSISGKLALGEQLALELSLPEGKTYELKPRVIEAEHYFLLSPLDERLTRFAQGQKLSGFLLRFAGGGLNLALRGFAYMNQALKKRVETSL